MVLFAYHESRKQKEALLDKEGYDELEQQMQYTLFHSLPDYFDIFSTNLTFLCCATIQLFWCHSEVSQNRNCPNGVHRSNEREKPKPVAISKLVDCYVISIQMGLRL